MKTPDNWKEGDSIIACHLVSSGAAILSGTATRNCEICMEEVWCAPVTIERAKLPNFHISCIHCYQEVDAEKKFMGHIKAGSTKLPTEG